jgi:molybdate transport system substrate-binding protein
VFHSRPIRLVPVALVAVLLLAGCSAAATTTEPEPTSSAPILSGSIVVDAAASLTGTFQQLSDQFHAANPGVTVTLNFGGSDALASQIVSGAPADVFASASPTTMEAVTDAGDAAGDPTVFARNSLEIAVPSANPGDITGLEDFADADKTIALCAATVPCGAAATKVFAAAGITPAPDTLEPDVKSVLTKVQLGEVDAALVYKTDVLAADHGVKGIRFPESKDAVTDYLVAPLKAGSHPTVAAAFIAFLVSATGQTVLTTAGFESAK